jgi:hypothetical protein
VNRLPLQLDFVARRRRPRALATLLLTAGVVAVAWVGLQVRDDRNALAGVDLHLARAAALARRVAPATGDTATVEFAFKATAELRTPWAGMLADLEQASVASKDDVALLVVEPDPVLHKVRVLAEARTLAAALAYVQRLQNSGSLRNALLESHEIRTDEAERPVRVQITAVWQQDAKAT